MILGRERHVHAACFTELDAAVADLAGGRTVALNAHAFPHEVPIGAVVYNLENVGIQVGASPLAFLGHELWDFSRRNVEAWHAAGRAVAHVPVGYHPSMERFRRLPAEACEHDVVFTGAMNDRRRAVLDALRQRGLRVAVVPYDLYGAQRDQILSRSRMALNMLYYEEGTHPVLRTAHLVANGVPVLCEHAPEAPTWALLQCAYGDLVERCAELLGRRREVLDHLADSSYVALRMHPMTLPIGPSS